MLPHLVRRILIVLLTAGGLGGSSGCLVTSVKWHAPVYVPPLAAEKICRSGSHARAERIYAKALNFERQCRDACVDLYFETARLTADSADCACFCRSRQLHESALMKVVDAGQRFQRFDPARGLTIRRGGHEHLIPIVHHGFVWEPDDFERMIPIGYYETNSIREKHQCRGLGVPFVVLRRDSLDRPFVRDRGAFSSTLVMVADSDASMDARDASKTCRLELYDPLRVDSVDVQGVRHKLAKDTTAAMVFMLQGKQWSYLNYFFNPESLGSDGGLYMLEPYQQDKIPLVLIHGLLSDPFTWIELVNELIVHPGFMEHYQVWAYEYSTGNPFLSSASELRQQLALCRATYDPLRSDPSMSNMILVGHSMGGLISKLQITSSGDQLWNSIANRPLDDLSLPDDVREELRRVFFFEPSPDISRVVFMATPHRGSSVASGPAGRIGSRLVQLPQSEYEMHQLIVRCNPDTFAKEFQDRIPTSIDLLNPHSGLLEAIGDLPAAEHVCMHTILGNLCCTLLQGKSDGIVPMFSAQEPRAVSEMRVKATHSQVKGHPEAVREVLYILNEHLRQSHVDRIRESDPRVIEVLEGEHCVSSGAGVNSASVADLSG